MSRYPRPHKTIADASTSELIIRALSEEHPLATVELRERLRVNFSRRLSFQAVAKAVRSLQVDGIVETNEHQHRLSTKWLLSLKRFAERASARYQSSASAASFSSKMPGQEMQIYQPRDCYTTDTLWGDIALDIIAREREQSLQLRLLSVISVDWGMLINLGRETSFWTQAMQQGVACQMLLAKDFFLNRWSAPLYRSAGLPIRLVSARNMPFSTFYNIFQEHVIQVECEPKMIEEWSKLSPLVEKDNASALRLAHKPCRCQITVTHNKTLADALWHQFTQAGRKGSSRN